MGGGLASLCTLEVRPTWTSSGKEARVMGTTTLEGTARDLVAPGKGILATDESHATIGRRFEPLGIANNEANRRRYRQMLFTTKVIRELITSVILFDETIRQATDVARPFVEVLAKERVAPTIKVDG